MTFLREFTPAEPSMAPLPELEDIEVIREEAYARGVEEGRAEERRAIGLDIIEALREVTARLDDLAAYKEQMRADVAAEAGMALSTVVHRVAPELALAGLADRARSLLENELRAAPRPLSLTAEPAMAARLIAVVSEMPDLDVLIEADDALAATRIEACWPEGEAVLDMEPLVAQLTALATELAPVPAPMADPEEELSDD